MTKYECLNCGAESFSAADLMKLKYAACSECGFDLQEAYLFLDHLRASGHINMFEAPPYVAEMLELDTLVAMKVVKSWMDYRSSRATHSITIDEILGRFDK